jgi:hypothetical protein
MDSSGTSADAKGPTQPLEVSVELLANLIYLARCTETHFPLCSAVTSIGQPKL